MLRFLPLGLALLVLAVVVFSGVWRHLSLEELKSRRDVLKGFVHAHPLESVTVYIVIYCAVVALSVPGALFMTLTGGFLFGSIVGGAAAVISVTSGAVIMFLVAHTAIGDAIHKRVNPNGLIRKIAAGVEKHAFLYILSLRLMPAAPIWLVNIAAAFVKTPLWIYAMATVIGVAPSTFIYASIGSSLDRVFAAGETPDLGTIFHLRVFLPLFALAALSLAPVGYQAWRRHSNALPKSRA